MNCADLSAQTRHAVERYHQHWKNRDIAGVMGMYHPQIEYYDFFNNRRIPLGELLDYITAAMPRSPEHSIEHTDRIRVDGDTAFIQYCSRLNLRDAGHLASFRASEAITVRDGMIWRVNEYASLIREEPVAGASRSPRQPPRLGLSAKQVQMMVLDLEQYFSRNKPHLDAAADLSSVARDTGYTRNQISHVLNQVLGVSFYQYMNQARIQDLLDRLHDGDVTRIDELAFAVGFNSLSVFYRCFRERTGCAPKHYLRQR